MTSLRVAERVRRTRSEGPGTRYALWVQGCSIRCAGCCNPEMFDPGAGSAITVDELCEVIGAESELEGVTFLGGEPFEQAAGLGNLAMRVRELGLSVMTFTGHTLESLRTSAVPSVVSLLRATDLLADGPFDARSPGSRWPWLGSQNQRLHFLTERYSPTDPAFAAKNTIELKVSRGELEVTGWAPVVLRLERGLTRSKLGSSR